MKNYEKVAEILSSGFLIAAGVLGTLVAILDFIGIDFTQGPWQWLKGPLPIILITVSILSLAIGLERYIRLRQIDNQFARLENLIERSSGGRFISSFEELYSEAIRLAENTRLRLRTASMSRDVQASNAYRTSIIDLISQNENVSALYWWIWLLLAISKTSQKKYTVRGALENSLKTNL
ncbi:MAG: hypothetical protein HZY76_11425 [Anaerolineae bacterium]|nr:MAG: hypothetical protein HZY76_11425 [Anaerolineae bacterium]